MPYNFNVLTIRAFSGIQIGIRKKLWFILKHYTAIWRIIYAKRLIERSSATTVGKRIRFHESCCVLPYYRNILWSMVRRKWVATFPRTHTASNLSTLKLSPLLPNAGSLPPDYMVITLKIKMWTGAVWSAITFACLFADVSEIQKKTKCLSCLKAVYFYVAFKALASSFKILACWIPVKPEIQ
jgi:hypothetical protein